MRDEEKVENEVEVKALSPEEELALLEGQLMKGARWFLWIAGLSVVNSVIILAGSEISFVIGLGITQVIDVLTVTTVDETAIVPRVIAFGFDLIIACFIVLFGVLGAGRRKWAFILGMILYGLDGLLLLLVRDYLGVVFHVYAMIGIYGGLRACRELQEKEAWGSTLEAALEERDGTAEFEDAIARVGGKKVVWPGVIGIFTVMYLIFYGMLSISAQSAMIVRALAALAMIGGLVGMAFRKKHAATLLVAGSAVVIVFSLYRFITKVISAMSEAGAAGWIVGCILMMILLFWPVFLILWFRRESVKEYIQENWE